LALTGSRVSLDCLMAEGFFYALELDRSHAAGTTAVTTEAVIMKDRA
jgi:hypothetical protein